MKIEPRLFLVWEVLGGRGLLLLEEAEVARSEERDVAKARFEVLAVGEEADLLRGVDFEG